VTPTSGQDALSTSSRSLKPNGEIIIKEMMKIKKLYEFEGNIAKGLIPWNELRNLFTMIDAVAASQQRSTGDAQLDRLKIMTDRLEKVVRK